MAETLCGVDDDGHSEVAAHRGHLAGRLHRPGVAAQNREMHQRRRVGRQLPAGLVGVEPADAVDRQSLHLEPAPRHDGQIRPELTGQAGQPTRAAPVVEQDVQGVVGAGGEVHVGVGHAGERANGGPTGIQCGAGGLCGLVSADLGFVTGVGRRRVDDRETLP